MNIMPVNNYQPTFGAKLNIKGKEFLPEEIVSKWQKQAKTIGTDFDTITLNIGKLEDKPIVRKNYLGHEMNAALKGRSVAAQADINGVVKEKDLTSAAYPSSMVIDRINNKVGKFFSELINK